MKIAGLTRIESTLYILGGVMWAVGLFRAIWFLVTDAPADDYQGAMITALVGWVIVVHAQVRQARKQLR